jgi:hypothetical protein
MEDDSEGDSDDEPSTILHVLNPISVPARKYLQPHCAPFTKGLGHPAYCQPSWQAN